MLNTRAKDAAIAENRSADEERFDPMALASRIKGQLYVGWYGEYKGLVSDLCATLGKGPWKEDAGTFGKQLLILRDDPARFGLKITLRRTKNGSVVVIEEDFDNLDTIAEWVKCADMENLPADYSNQIPSEQELQTEADLPPVLCPPETATSDAIPDIKPSGTAMSPLLPDLHRPLTTPDAPLEA